MPIRADQLREKEDFQKLILERLEEDNKFRIRPNTAYKPGLAMDTEVLLEFLEDTQHDEMERLRRMYKDRTNDTVINYINSEINKESRGLIDVIKHGVEFDNGVTLQLKMCIRDRYERSEERQGYRSGHYSRNLTTTSGDVTLKVPRLKGISFETAIIERYRRRESSVEEALIEMYLAGVSVRRVEDITEALWGSKVSPSTISELNKNCLLYTSQTAAGRTK